MIPHQLTLYHFLSYRHVQLNFDGLHVACICGPNGAGKSSLLEAIAWAVWGQGRASSEDGIIHLGSVEARVDFVFSHQQTTYRILRSRHRQQGGQLEFQVETAGQFRSLTQRNIRATQALICQTLRLDYDTFVNSAYLRQGKADEFMVKRPSERKQILADLLKLSQYDQLADQAKGRSRQAQAEANLLGQTLAQWEGELAQRPNLEAAAAALAQELTTLEAQTQAAEGELAHWQAIAQQRQTATQQLALLAQQQRHGQEARSRLEAEIQTQQGLLRQQEDILAQGEAIQAGWAELQALRQAEEALATRFAQLQEYQARHQTLEQAHQAQIHTAEQQRQQAIHQQTWIDQQLATLEGTLAKQDTIADALTQLQAAQARLQYLDQLQATAAPLKQQQQDLQRELAQAQAHLTAHLQALARTAQQVETQLAQHPQVEAAARALGKTLEQLAARRAYQEQVREKGLERRSFMERLQASQRLYETQLGQLDQKLHLLSDPDATCPLCDSPLDALHWQLVRRRHQAEREDIEREIWAIREQLLVSEREIQVLRQEYRDLEIELADYTRALEQRGHLQAQLSSGETLRQQLRQLTQERCQGEAQLRQGTYAPELHQALAQVSAQLAALGYDERDHALARGQVDRLRWAEIKQAEVQQAQRQQGQLLAQRPQWVAAQAEAEAQLAALAQAPVVAELAELEAAMAALDYTLAEHQRVREALRQAQPWADRWRQWQQAQEQVPLLQGQGQALAEQYQALLTQQGAIQAEIAALEATLATLPDPVAPMAQLHQANRDRQRQREILLNRQGALTQQLAQLATLATQAETARATLLKAQHETQVYQELAIAFGRNGLQALLIENLLPQLETETNQILSRLSAHQLQVQFVTQRASRQKSPSKAKLIDTLDILIADAQGTRPYETYSGGEAFRVNFAIRLALARLLAQRSGTPLQLLIIDEGFGTQDLEGCHRLVGAINAIAADFRCILVVTHIPHFREAFQTRIDVTKTPTGSEITLSL